MKLEAALKKIRNRAKAVNREVVIDPRDHHNNGSPQGLCSLQRFGAVDVLLDQQ